LIQRFAFFVPPIVFVLIAECRAVGP